MLSEEEFRRRISENLFLLRTYYGYTQQQIASFLGCERSPYTYLEKGKTYQFLVAYIVFRRNRCGQSCRQLTFLVWGKVNSGEEQGGYNITFGWAIVSYFHSVLLGDISGIPDWGHI